MSVLRMPNYGREKWIKMFNDLKTTGSLHAPRGHRTLEIENYHVDIDPITDRFCSFEARDLSLKYLAGEFGWYLGADNSDTFIETLSQFWSTIKADYRPYWNSNYGVPIFRLGQFDKCLDVLKADPDSRQACIAINRYEVVTSDSKDKICTNAIMFRIRDNKLNMTVQMRSNDIVLGLCYDLPMFCFMQEMLVVLLNEFYPNLEIGTYHHTSGSFHIYEKHFDMMESIIASKPSSYKIVDLPAIDNSAQVDMLMSRFSVWSKQVLTGRDIRTIPAVLKRSKTSSVIPTFTSTLLRWLVDPNCLAK